MSLEINSDKFAQNHELFISKCRKCGSVKSSGGVRCCPRRGSRRKLLEERRKRIDGLSYTAGADLQLAPIRPLKQRMKSIQHKNRLVIAKAA